MTKQVPSLPLNKPDFETGRVELVRTYVGKMIQRRHLLWKCGQKDEDDTYYICSNHEMEKKTLTKKLKRKHATKLDHSINVERTFYSPTGKGMKAEEKPTDSSKGLGIEREYARNVDNFGKDLSYLRNNAHGTMQPLVDVSYTATHLLMEALEREDDLQVELKSVKQKNEDLKETMRQMIDGT